MTANNSPTNVPFNLYDHEVSWQPFAGIENLELTLCDIDEERKSSICWCDSRRTKR